MNPEFRRNLWLELTPRRMVLTLGVFALIFAASVLAGGGNYGPVAVAAPLYYLVVVLWGTRNAAMSVVGEIRDRTWDSQRLSSLSAAQLVWGKLFGSTIHNWFCGAICLFVLLFWGAAHHGGIPVIVNCIFLVADGIIAQLATLLASLVAIRRRQSHSRLEVFLYQIVGLAAAIVAHNLWSVADPSSALATGNHVIESIAWWGTAFDSRPFFLLSLAAFAGWMMVGCYREMRLELQMRNGPYVWLGFLAFIGLYVGGFDGWLARDSAIVMHDVVALRLALVAFAFAVLTYVMVLIEPKDLVLYRWYANQISSGKIGAALWSLQAWIMSYTVTAAFAVLLAIWLLAFESDARSGSLVVIAMLGFLTRDAAIFIFYQTLPGRRRGDLASVITLICLYGLLPAIFQGVGLHGALFLFYPLPLDVPLLAVIAAWGEAAAIALAAFGRIGFGGQPALKTAIQNPV